jgi:hypothetical protein
MLNVSSGSVSRVLTEQQVYSKMYYQARVKPKVDEEIRGREVDMAEMIAIRARLTRETYEDESNAIKEEVRQEKRLADEKRVESSDLLQKELDGELMREHSPEEYDKYGFHLMIPIVCLWLAGIKRQCWSWFATSSKHFSPRLVGHGLC